MKEFQNQCSRIKKGTDEQKLEIGVLMRLEQDCEC
jgi:hypothetical protein